MKGDSGKLNLADKVELKRILSREDEAETSAMADSSPRRAARQCSSVWPALRGLKVWQTNRSLARQLFVSRRLAAPVVYARKHVKLRIVDIRKASECETRNQANNNHRSRSAKPATRKATKPTSNTIEASTLLPIFFPRIDNPTLATRHGGQYLEIRYQAILDGRPHVMDNKRISLEICGMAATGTCGQSEARYARHKMTDK